MMLKTVFLFNIFYLSFGTNYFNDNDWILTLNQGWPFGVCQSNSVAISIMADGIPVPKNIEYTCNDDGSVTKSEYASISADGECMNIQNSVNYIGNFTNPGDLYAFECNSTNNYAEVNFFGHLGTAPQVSAQCQTPALGGEGNFKWSINSCATNGENSNMLTCTPGVINFTTYGNSICDPSNIVAVVTIAEGQCATYGDRKIPLGMVEFDLFVYATYGSCILSEPTIAPSLAPTMEPTQITTEPTLTPSAITELPTTVTSAPVTSPENDSKANTSVIYTFSIIFTIAIAFMLS